MNCIGWFTGRIERLINYILGTENRVDYINGADQLPPPLSKEEEQKTFELLKTDEKKARELLIIHNLRLVVYIAKKFESTGVGIEDLVSIGTIGLIKAVKTFCPDKNIKLATYASRCIENEILMFLRKASQHKNDISIDEPLNIDWDGNELLLSDILGTDDDVVNKGIEMETEKQILRQEINKLDERERQIMEMRFGLVNGHEMTQKQVAEKVGISQSYISRLEKRIINGIREKLEKIC
ncbi:RNA polymerase sporulation sigma factor SigE [Ruminococcus sp. FC2018]|uniref:RNA polymerase sporulation sigma factor SigE n=1 Tax=Ruminococcus sp. FC2018 TaxID=1410617 RepID=UPI0006846BE2|nr:RNA polymerase sporulation sigma factor SigE [Ruminococcus sp. FC2018]